MADQPKEVRYLTDDRDEDEQNELIITYGGNGDIYIAVAPQGEGWVGKSVRISTSGGASSRVPGLAPALANAFRALAAATPGYGVTHLE